MSPRVVRNGKGEVWRVDIDVPKTQPYNRKKFLGWVDYKDSPSPPYWPTAGWYAGAGVVCHVTGLGTLEEAMTALLDAHGIVVAEWSRV